MMRLLLTIFSVSLLLAGCEQTAPEAASHPPTVVTAPLPDAFNAYWYQGKAELSGYQLLQRRYGAYRKGKAVLVFVTEDFLTEKQVKQERPGPAPAVNVLKLNALHRFPTGSYDYAMMQSVFTPIPQDTLLPTLKISGSVQDWCGHTYTQLNYQDAAKAYTINSHSYFQDENDTIYVVDAVIPEDALWTRLRFSPGYLPQDTVRLLPGTFFSRLHHTAITPQIAYCTLSEVDTLYHYQVRYPELGRALHIYFDRAFPHRIQQWETYNQSDRSDTLTLYSRGTRNRTFMLDYWSKQSETDSMYRRQLFD